METISSTTTTTTTTTTIKPTPETKSKLIKLNERPADIACQQVRKKFPGKRLGQRIIEGKKADFDEFPHMVALGYPVPGTNQFKWDCGGSLISEQYVLTAAHCIQKTYRPVITRMGRLNIKEGCTAPDCIGIDIDIDSITLHNKWSEILKYNDIALIRLKEPVNETNSLHSACLYTDTANLNENLNLTISGWGHTNFATKEKSEYLLKAIVKPVGRTKCAQDFAPVLGRGFSFPNGIIERQLCAYDNKSDTCQGDSGGPIQISDESWVSTIVGITSVGLVCGGSVPGLYTKVVSYLDWIEPIVWPDFKN